MIVALAAATVLALCDPTLKTCAKFEPTDALVMHRVALCNALESAWVTDIDALWTTLRSRQADADEAIFVRGLLAGTAAERQERDARCYAWARGERDTP